MEARHRYEVHWTRYVCAPEYGPEAYFLTSGKEAFPFGKGQAFASGEEASMAADAYAHFISDEASHVSVFRMNGYCGEGQYIKRTQETFSGPLQ